jgi:hypothetical protein
MTEPVLVVHGVATHVEAEFNATVEALARKLGDRWQLIPVFWGDLGANTDESLLDALPPFPGAQVRGAADEVDPALVEALFGEPPSEGAVRGAGQENAIVAGAEAAKGGAASEQVRGPSGTEAIRDAVRDELPNTRVLRHIHDPAVLEAVGRALGAAAGQLPADGGGGGAGGGGLVRGDDVGVDDIFGGGGGDTRGVFSNIRDTSRALLREIDGMLGKTVGNALGDLNQTLRRAYGRQVLTFLGDIFVYQREQNAIQQRLWDAIADHAPGHGTREQPIRVIAHSLGGLVAFDAAVRPDKPLWIKSFVTFGSQPAMFHVVNPRKGLAPYVKGTPVTLPATIGRWANLWEPMDPLAFAATPVFQLASRAAPADSPINNLASALVRLKGNTHGSYWESDELIRQLAQSL